MPARGEEFHLDSTPRETNGRTPLGVYVDRVETAFDSGDYAVTNGLIHAAPLVAWYGLRPERFVEIVTVLAQRPELSNGFAPFVSAFLASGGAEDLEGQIPDSVFEGSGLSPEAGMLIGKVILLRNQGRPVEALRLLDEFTDPLGAIRPTFDINHGWGLFLAVQHGLTAMLAGDFATALDSFTRARVHARVPALSFLTRDAHVKAALVEALYGNPDYAQTLLLEAERIPRTESWAEETIDVARDIASSLLKDVSSEESMRLLGSIPLHEVGESWPFYVAALQRALVGADRLAEARRRLALFERLPLPRAEGEGYAGSVLPLTGAIRSMLSDDLAGARELLQRADASIAVTRLLGAFLELMAGSPREAINQVAGLHEQTAPLRSLDLWRLAVIAGSLLSLGASDECREVLETVLDLPQPLSPHEVVLFSAKVREFAESQFEQWPRVEEEWVTLRFDIFPEQREALTVRERELLKELATGASREGIAKAQFISVNTLKTHLRSIYRKLGVRSRTAAVLEAERRDLI